MRFVESLCDTNEDARYYLYDAPAPKLLGVTSTRITKLDSRGYKRRETDYELEVCDLTPKDMAMIELINTLYVAHLREQEDDDFTDAVMSAAAGGAIVSY